MKLDPSVSRAVLAFFWVGCLVALLPIQAADAEREKPMFEGTQVPQPADTLHQLFIPLLQSPKPGSPALPPAPGPDGSPIFGLGVYSWTYGLDDLPGLEADWLRPEPLIWSEVEPEKGTRDWSSLAGLEDELRSATARGARVVLIVTGTPGWARKVPRSACGPIIESELPAFGRFMRDLVARYSAPPYAVKYWEFWNEPDVDPSLSGSKDFGCWGDKEDFYYGGAYYAELLKAVYPEIKTADPEAQVLVGGLLLACDPRVPALCEGTNDQDRPARFLEGILRGGGGPYFDGVSFHAYDSYGGALGVYGNGNWGNTWDTSGPAVIAKGRFLRAVLAQYGFPEKALIVSETAVANREALCDANCELTKAYFVPQLYLATLAEGYVGSIWYCVKCGWRHVDLVGENGQPLPAYQAYTTAWQQLRGAEYLGPLALGEKVRGYELKRGDHRLWVVWALDPSQHPVALPGQVAAVVDALGQPQPSRGQSLSVTLKPVYIEWIP